MIVRPHARRSRATLIWGALFSLALIGGAQIYLPAWGSNSRDLFYSLRRDRLLQRLSEPQLTAADAKPRLVVTLGSSRVYNAIDGQRLEQELESATGQRIRVANFATPGAGPFLNMVLLGRLLRDDIQPDLIIVEALPKFFDTDNDLPNSFPPGFISKCPGDEEWLRSHDIPLRLTPADREGIAIYEYRTEILGRLARHLLTRKEQSRVQDFGRSIDFWGSGLFLTEVDAERRQAGLRVAKREYYQAYQDVVWGEGGFHIMRRLLGACHDRGIATMVVLMPEGDEMRSWYRAGAQDELVERLQTLTKDFDSSLIVSSQWMREDDFADSHHILARGAEKFSTQLGREAIAPYLEHSIARGEQNPIRR